MAGAAHAATRAEDCLCGGQEDGGRPTLGKAGARLVFDRCLFGIEFRCWTIGGLLGFGRGGLDGEFRLSRR